MRLCLLPALPPPPPSPINPWPCTVLPSPTPALVSFIFVSSLFFFFPRSIHSVAEKARSVQNVRGTSPEGSDSSIFPGVFQELSWFSFLECFAVHTVTLFHWHLMKPQVHTLGGRWAPEVMHGPIGHHRQPLEATYTPCTYHCEYSRTHENPRRC